MNYDHVVFDIWEVSLKKKKSKKFLKGISEKILNCLFGIFKSETLLSDWRCIDECH